MYAVSLCDCTIKYAVIAQSPTFVGGGEGDASAKRGTSGGKARAVGGDYRLTLKREEPGGREGGANVALPAHRMGVELVEFYIPATSVRGAVRHFLTRRIERAMSGIELDSRYAVDRLRAEDVEQKAKDLYGPPGEEPYWRARFGNVLLRHLFGSEARRGAVMFEDLVAKQQQLRRSHYSNVPSDFGQGSLGVNSYLRVLTHNRLDRFTMASTEGLRNVAALEAGTALTGAVTLTNFAWWQVGALAVAFAAMNEGSLGLGARTAVGLGRVSVKVTELVVRWHPGVAPESFTVLPGAGVCARMASTSADAAYDDRRLGRFESGGARQMFVEDPDDVVETETEGDPAASDGALFDISRRWRGAEAQTILTRASARLAATATSIGVPPSA
jgi:CRISPR/Cas system CSM-associated protein Csm3 (group 7 of RAMP superfamily)